MLDPQPSSELEQRFALVLTEYLESLEAGHPDDRMALVARHPELADELRAFFTRQDRVQQLATPLRALAGSGGSYSGLRRSTGTQSPQDVSRCPNLVAWTSVPS